MTWATAVIPARRNCCPKNISTGWIALEGCDLLPVCNGSSCFTASPYPHPFGTFSRKEKDKSRLDTPASWSAGARGRAGGHAPFLGQLDPVKAALAPFQHRALRQA